MSDRRITLIGIAALGAIAILHALVLFMPGAPSGIDGGNWLAFGTLDRPGMVYPPFIPATFAPLVAWLGAPLATAVAGAVAAVAPGLAILAVLAWARQPSAGVVAALAVVASRAVGEIAAWGGYPQPIAMAAALIALVALAAYLLGVPRAALATFGVSFAVVVATSHLIAVPTVGAIALMLGGAAVVHRRRAVRPIAVAAALTALPFAALAPTYAAIFATIGGGGSGTWIQLDDAERVLGLVWPAYLAVLILVPLGLALAGRRASVAAALSPRDVALVVAASAAAITWTLAYALSGEPRLLHDMGVLALFGIAAIAPLARTIVRQGRVRLGLATGAVVVAAWIVATGLLAFPDQVAFYRFVTKDRFDAIEWLAEHAAAEPRSILVADVSGVVLGWWTEGMVGREVLFASDLRWLRFPTERDRARQANALLYRSGFPSIESASTIREAGIEYVFLPSAGAFGVDPTDPPGGWQVVFAAGDTVVLVPAA